MSDAPADEGPWTKYQQQKTAAEGPWTKYQQQKPQERPGWLGSLGSGAMHGLGNVLYGAAQLGPRIPSPFAPFESDRLKQANVAEAGKIDTEAQQRQQVYQASPAVRAHPILSKIGEIGGEIAGTAPLSFIPGLGGAQTAMRTGAGLVGRGAALGGMGAAAAPVTGGDYWSEKGKQVALGAALGGALPAAGSAIAPRLPAPAVVNKAFRPLWNFFTGAEERTVDGFDRTVARQVLDPIGASIPNGLKGHALASATEDAIGSAYDKVLPNITLARDGLMKGSPELEMTISELDPDEARQFGKIVENRLLGKFPPTGVMDGETVKQVQSDLGRRANSFLGTNKDELGRALLDTLHHFNDQIAEQNPQFAGELRRANDAFKMWARMRQAAGGATSSGRFTPSDLLRAVRGQDPSSGRRAFARGDAVLQGYGEAGYSALGAPRSSAMELARIFTSKGLLAELGRDVVQPVARGMKAATPFAAGPGGMLAGQMSNQGVPPIRRAAPIRPQTSTPPMRGPSEKVDYIEPPPRASVTGP